MLLFKNPNGDIQNATKEDLLHISVFMKDILCCIQNATKEALLQKSEAKITLELGVNLASL